MPQTKTYIANTLTILMLASGIFGVIFRNILVYLVGAITPGYSPISGLISELSAEGMAYEHLMNTGSLMAFGAFTIIASKALQLRLPGRETALSTAYMAVAGVSFIGIGLFPCPPGCDPEIASNQMMVHALCGFIASLSLSLSAFVYGIGFLKGNRSRIYKIALILGIIGVIAFTTLWAGIIAAEYGVNNVLYEWKGMLQRLNIAAGDLWVVIACVYTLIKRPPARAPEVFRAEQTQAGDMR
ncbi:DUF998 domain-containing protein [Robertkochia sediminum]|uniref:DUF998 domain-containing protein n=1 Tax=Robertkochia sediminum TaxID=2785326 RepID=UPI0019314D91|nr:DUF998 domain-containing protein [Robertkochia sediminum]MBL7471589.1 DUF998 domain-containing protein [Robertkochia sediminum]